MKCVYLQQSLLPVVQFSSCPSLVLQLHSLQDGTVKMSPRLLLQPDTRSKSDTDCKNNYTQATANDYFHFLFGQKVETICTNIILQQHHTEGTRRKPDFCFGFWWTSAPQAASYHNARGDEDVDLVSDHYSSSDVPQPADPPDHCFAPLVQTQAETHTHTGLRSRCKRTLTDNSISLKNNCLTTLPHQCATRLSWTTNQISYFVSDTPRS